MTATSTATANFTDAMVARIQAVSDENNGLDQALCESLAKELGKDSYRSITAKAKRMGLPYRRKVATTKTGEPVENKPAIVDSIAKLIGATSAELDGLEKASKQALQRLRSEFQALSA